MNVKELELLVLQGKSLTVENYELNDLLAKENFNISKGVKIANNLSELKESVKDFNSHLESLSQRLQVINEVFTEWNDTLSQDFVNEYSKISQFLADFERDTIDSKTEILDYLERIEELNNTDYD